MIDNKVLYYPHTEFYDINWVKASLCIWDKIYRIVPSSYTPYDYDELQVFIENGLIENIKIENDDLAQTANKFTEFWDNVPSMPAGIEGYDSINLHKDKVDARLLPILESLSKTFNVSEWLNLSEPVVNAYMLFFAETISRRRKLPKVTDNPDMYSVMHYFLSDGNVDEDFCTGQQEEYTSNLILESILPVGIESISSEKIIEFRYETVKERTSFRNYVGELIDEIKEIESESYAKELVFDKISDLEKVNGNIKQYIKEFGYDFMRSALIVGLPTTLTAMSTFGGSSYPFEIRNILGSVSIGAVSSLANILNSRRKKWTSSEALFLHKMNNKFGSSRGLELSPVRHYRILEEFIND